ncbi:inactive protein RESTRICTED TEV MOVEMENT 1 [Nicotiana tabacum]|uniref:Inactive protein RESTRICTED TEV MOVEMENT 1 n=3 Tax=Nicotiana TaxID=4085 RepID=A0A1S3ZGX0_TOBAC|nr:PREDICTED: inactive protein RESTRICTED TEV MOVEMENT 1-like [Nicotiana sylvestris]XP_009763016.1 PREDICTED: inactive protein RESTRICTED TEV MOVEMENT 1-like [Nicotiana sylvestris]XP_016463619.1 PREDICTED: inactive protein RESTRICTED TEV MOVEMENT 1-like [Nicotiana tabacum]XP_016463620.1 PREDICTED: inactive protein RESTRICTED TEV MOVEMENT 1-like [Nicotiana tabacum]
MDMIKVGPAGGNRGTIWDEKGRDLVGGIFVSYSRDRVLSLQFFFHENGNLVQSNKHGIDDCRNFYAVVFDYPSEFLTSISGSYINTGYATVLESIKFSTNKGSYGPFGCTLPSTGANNFNFEIGNHRFFGGFHGRNNSSGVESIGIYVKPIIPSMKNLRIQK